MRTAGLVFAWLMLNAAMGCAQGELPLASNGGPLNIKPDLPASDQPLTPKPDNEGVYPIGPGIIVPTLVHALPAVQSTEDIPECEPPIVVLFAVIGIDGRANVRQFLTPRNNACANLAQLVVRQALFQPAKLNGHPVAVRACLTVPFRPERPAVPSIGRCPPDVDPHQMREVVTSLADAKTSGPLSEQPTPLPDEHGVYSLGPGIVSPVPISFKQAEPSDAVAPCKHPIVVSAVANVDGTIKVSGVYDPDDRSCDNLAIAAIEQTRLRPATLNGTPVPVLVCLGVPFANPQLPPVPRPTRCPRNLGATPVGSADDFKPRPGTKQPVPIYTPSPEYSREARKKNIQGDVTISIIVDESGLATEARLVKGIGYGLDENALEAVRKYRFHPAMLDGKPVPFQTNIEVKFRLEEN